MKTTIGGDRLGSGNKQEVSMKNYSRSTHDLSYTWRSTVSPGTLVPFMSRLALPGDTWDINLNCEVLTLPTKGPLFGSFKVQLDVFQVPIRLYNGRLHMNELGIGMEMANVKLPLVNILARIRQEWTDHMYINPSSLLKYLGISGFGRPTGATLAVNKSFNAIPFLGYFDIYKQYYANKQEDLGYCIHSDDNTIEYSPVDAWMFVESFGNIKIPLLNDFNVRSVDTDEIQELAIEYGAGSPVPDITTVFVNVDGSDVLANTVMANWTYNENTGQLLFTNPIGNTVIDLYVPGDQNTLPQDPANAVTVRLQSFPLKNIDDMRKKLLRWDQDDVAYVIDGGDDFPYRLHRTSIASPEGNIYSATTTQEQLCVKTYQSDLFNNWISTEWIDGANGINEITKVDTSSGSFTIDSLNLANKVYNMLNRIAISGGTYDDWLQAVYTHDRTRSVENPIYHGSLIKQLAFQEVVSNSEAVTQDGEVQPLGQLAGRGRLTDKNKGGKIVISVDEPSYLLGIFSLTPLVDVSQGNQWDVNLKTLDDLHKPALDSIGYQDLVTEQMHWAGSIFDTVTGETTYESAGKQPAWINYMTDVNRCYGNFAIDSKDMFMTLNRRYEFDATGITDLTTYIDPSKFNFIFAQTDLSSMNFWVQIRNSIIARRKMSAKVIPNL